MEPFNADLEKVTPKLKIAQANKVLYDKPYQYKSPIDLRNYKKKTNIMPFKKGEYDLINREKNSSSMLGHHIEELIKQPKQMLKSNHNYQIQWSNHNTLDEMPIITSNKRQNDFKLKLDNIQSNVDTI